MKNNLKLRVYLTLALAFSAGNVNAQKESVESSSVELTNKVLRQAYFSFGDDLNYFYAHGFYYYGNDSLEISIQTTPWKDSTVYLVNNKKDEFAITFLRGTDEVRGISIRVRDGYTSSATEWLQYCDPPCMDSCIGCKEDYTFRPFYKSYDGGETKDEISSDEFIKKVEIFFAPF